MPGGRKSDCLGAAAAREELPRNAEELEFEDLSSDVVEKSPDYFGHDVAGAGKEDAVKEAYSAVAEWSGYYTHLPS